MKKNRKKERILTWLGFVIVILILATGLFFAGRYGYKQYKKYVVAQEEIKQEAEQQQIFEEEKEKALEEAEQKAIEEAAATEESFDQEALDAIFDDSIEEESIEEAEEAALEEKAIEIVSSMNLEQKVAQMFFVKQEAITGVEVCTAAGEMTKEALNKYPVGGIIYFEDNIEDPEQLLEMTSNIQSYEKEILNIPIFIGIDEEGGNIAPIANNEKFEIENTETLKEIGSSADPNNAYVAGNTIGLYLNKYGFNLDFAPSADVLTIEDAVIGDKSFGDDEEIVSQMVVSYHEGLRDAGVISCINHYPGQGGVSKDTEKAKVILNKDWEELSKAELVPFIRTVNEGVSFIMTSHICVPELTGEEIPTTFSSVMINDKLRNQLGFKGVIITDALDKSAITNSYSSKEAAINAINAGVDMLFMPEKFEEAYNGIISAIESGDLSEDRINESVIRIVKEKIKING